MTKIIHVQYYALLREQSGKNNETLSVSIATAHDLYRHLQKQYKFSLETDVMRVAVNGSFTDWTTEIHSNDTVVFIPPVAGG